MRKEILFVAVDVGCIECGEDSAVLGVFVSRAKAEAVCAEHKERQAEEWHGQHSFRVFEVDGIGAEHRAEYGYPEDEEGEEAE